MASSSARQRSVLITGCSPGGIGYALAKEFQSRGFRVIATARRDSVLETLSAEGFSTVKLEVTSEASINACKPQVEKLVDGKLDILVNNAGIGTTLPATDTPLSTTRRIFETNLFGPMALTSTLLPLLLPTEGLVINISSLSSQVPYVFGSSYAASKGALTSWSRVLRAELEPLGVKVQCVMAGTVVSNIWESSARDELPEGSLYSPVRYLWEKRLGYSQKPEGGPIATETFARGVVDRALAREVPVVLRGLGWVGRPDWVYLGGSSRVYWWGAWLGEWVMDLWARRNFRLGELTKLVGRQGDEKAKKG